MKSKLFKKFFLTTGFIVVISISIMMLTLIIFLNTYFAKTNYKNLDKCCKQVSENITSQTKINGENSDFQFFISTVSDVTGNEIFVTDAKGRVLLCSCNNDNFCNARGKIVSSKAINDLKDKSVFELGNLGIYNKERYSVAKPLTAKSGAIYGYVFATTPLSAISEVLSVVLRQYLLSAIIPVIIMFFAFYFMSYKLTKPLKSMSEAAHAMAHGDFSKRIPVMTDDEIGELSIAFNQMTNSLVQLENTRRSFVANVSHELKTPMTTIGGFIDGILDGTIEKDKQEYYLNIISEEVKRLTRLVQSMLSMSKLESGDYELKPQTFNFKEMLLNIVISCEQRIANAHINIDGLDKFSDVNIFADKDSIYQVVYNLVDNAIKFTNDGGTITFSNKVDNLKLMFTIKNTGCGIPARQLPFIFERFYKADTARSAKKDSTGLGLYITKSIIKAHNGKISVESIENEFTAFTVTLPIK